MQECLFTDETPAFAKVLLPAGTVNLAGCLIGTLKKFLKFERWKIKKHIS